MRNQENRGTIQGVLDEALGSTPHVRILRYLCRAGGEHTGRAIGRAIQVSHPSVHHALRTLAGRGMVHAIRHGPAIAYRLNEDHWLIRRGLLPLFEVEAAFLTTLAEATRSAAKVPVRSVLVFGSVARGEAGPQSDIDLLCLTSNATAAGEAERNLAEAGPSLRRQFGRRVLAMVLPAAELARRYRRRHELTREIVETGWVIAGDSMSEVFR